MQKTKFLKLTIISFILFFAISFGIVYAFDCKTECQPPLTTFSNGSSTFNVSFPPGGGTTCKTIADCPTITLPDNATIFSMKVDMELTDPDSEIGTPFIWVPLSATNGLVQIKTSDGSFVSKFTNAIISDCTANCDTNTPIWVVRGASLCNFSNPSRITVMPGGDVWIANRGSSKVVRVGLVDPINNMEEYECKGSYTVGPGARGVTFDIEGNIWVGDNGDNFVWKFNPDGTYAWSAPHKANIGCTTYGMIADAYGNVWVSSGGCDTVVKIDINNCDPASCPTSNSGNFTSGTTPYGIGMDNEGDIWTGDWTGNKVHEIDGDDLGGTTGIVVSNCSTAAAGCCTGTAVDKDNNVWTSGHSENKIYVFKNGNCGDRYEKSAVCTKGNKYPHGIAIDFDNHAWAVCRQGEVIKYEFDGTNITELKRIDLNGAGSGSSDSASYNYSDMTGLRTVPKSISVDGGASIPLSADGTFEIYSGVCIPADLSSCINPPGSITCGSTDGLCDIPLEIFSMQAGNYTLKNLEVIYGKQIPITTGGMVPCGRENNDPATPWDDTEPCSLCYLIMLLNQITNFLLKIASAIAILAFVITGFLFITSSGNPERKNLAKTSFKWIIVGFFIIFLAWLFVDFLLSVWGYLDPLGGKWEVVCD